MPGTLVLVRHGESESNKLNLFTGWKDPPLTEKGRGEALECAIKLRNAGCTHYDIAFTSTLTRARQTLGIILKEIGQEIKTYEDQALNERDYGDLSGLNKDDAREKWGNEQVHIWRRSYDVPPPGGESLKMTAERTLPYYTKEIAPLVKRGARVLVVAHGNSLRSIIMKIDGLNEEKIVALEQSTGETTLYKLDESGNVLDKRILT